ncbi:hypothetical protein AKJ16_DCAP15349 [Drosera capensis]
MLSHSLSLSLPSTTTTTSTAAPLRHRHHHSLHLPLRSCPLSFPRFRKPISPRASNSFRAPISENETAANFLESKSATDYLRFRGGESGEGEGELQTAVVGFRKRFPWSILRPFLKVDLVSTIHIADKEYFDTLQKQLESYDCVLFEMVISKEGLENDKGFTAARRLKSTRTQGFSILGFVQKQMARLMSLEFQLDGLNFEAGNFYHADLDFETFQAQQLKKGESMMTLARDMTLRSAEEILQPASIPENLGPWKSKLLWASRVLPMPLVWLVLIKGVCADAGDRVTDYPEFKALSRLDLAAALNITEVLEDEAKTVIVGERNKAATDALRSAIDAGNNKIAILYGGGHMPDMGRRLREEFDLVPSSVQWIPAWSITKRDLDSTSYPFLRRMAEFSGWPLNRYQTLALVIFSSVLTLDLLFWELFLGTALYLHLIQSEEKRAREKYRRKKYQKQAKSEMNGTSEAIVGVTVLVTVTSLAIVFCLVLVLLAELYCSFLLSRHQLIKGESSTTISSSDTVAAEEAS